MIKFAKINNLDKDDSNYICYIMNIHFYFGEKIFELVKEKYPKVYVDMIELLDEIRRNKGTAVKGSTVKETKVSPNQSVLTMFCKTINNYKNLSLDDFYFCLTNVRNFGSVNSTYSFIIDNKDFWLNQHWDIIQSFFDVMFKETKVKIYRVD